MGKGVNVTYLPRNIELKLNAYESGWLFGALSTTKYRITKEPAKTFMDRMKDECPVM